jgi:hypothetical protein
MFKVKNFCKIQILEHYFATDGKITAKIHKIVNFMKQAIEAMVLQLNETGYRSHGATTS